VLELDHSRGVKASTRSEPSRTKATERPAFSPETAHTGRCDDPARGGAQTADHRRTTLSSQTYAPTFTLRRRRTPAGLAAQRPDWRCGARKERLRPHRCSASARLRPSTSDTTNRGAGHAAGHGSLLRDIMAGRGVHSTERKRHSADAYSPAGPRVAEGGQRPPCERSSRLIRAKSECSDDVPSMMIGAYRAGIELAATAAGENPSYFQRRPVAPGNRSGSAVIDCRAGTGAPVTTYPEKWATRDVNDRTQQQQRLRFAATWRRPPGTLQSASALSDRLLARGAHDPRMGSESANRR